MVEETAIVPLVDLVPAIPDFSEEEEVEETEPLVTSERRSVKPLTVDEPETEVVEDSPSAIVANVLGWSLARRSNSNLGAKVTTGIPRVLLLTLGGRRSSN